MYGKNGKNKKNKPLYNLKKFTVWCVRIPRKEQSQINVESGPCIICRQRLRLLGFGKIAFSNSRGEIEIHNLEKYTKVFITNNHRRFLKGGPLNDIKSINESLDFIKII